MSNPIYEGNDKYVFISYRHTEPDRTIARQVVQRLIQDGYRVWYDEELRYGPEWDEEVANHLLNAWLFIPFISKAYFESRNCVNELKTAWGEEKHILPFYTDSDGLPDYMPGWYKLNYSRMQSVFWLRAQHNSDKIYDDLYAKCEELEECKGSVTTKVESKAQTASKMPVRKEKQSSADKGFISLASLLKSKVQAINKKPVREDKQSLTNEDLLGAEVVSISKAQTESKRPVKEEKQSLTDEDLIDAKLVPILQVGDIVTFGTYPQTETGKGSTPIEWLVLAREGEKALLISRYGLDTIPYNDQFVDVTWETCTLRKWLNSTFISQAFTKKEQVAIAETDVDNSRNQGYSELKTNGGNNTQDKVFLLSYAEANRYLGVSWNKWSSKAQVSPTAYAKKAGVYTNTYYKTEEGKEAGWWWLRSPGSLLNHAALVFRDGSLRNYSVDAGSGCVRPALWVNLESDIF